MLITKLNCAGSICCDRTGFRSDICFVKGDVRTSSAKSSIFLYSSDQSNNEQEKIERIKASVQRKGEKGSENKKKEQLHRIISQLNFVQAHLITWQN